jgi:hypothetical protein
VRQARSHRGFQCAGTRQHLLASSTMDWAQFLGQHWAALAIPGLMMIVAARGVIGRRRNQIGGPVLTGTGRVVKVEPGGRSRFAPSSDQRAWYDVTLLLHIPEMPGSGSYDVIRMRYRYRNPIPSSSRSSSNGRCRRTRERRRPGHRKRRGGLLTQATPSESSASEYCLDAV